MIQIQIKDVLNHKAYSWPETLITEQIRFEKPVCEKKLMLTNEAKEAIPFQLTNVKKVNGRVAAADLHFMASLTPKQEHNFCLTEQNQIVKQPEVPGIFDIHTLVNGNLFELTAYGKHMSFCVPFEDVECRIQNTGPIFTDVAAVCTRDTRKYTLSIRIPKTLPFWEITEKMEGFDDDNQTFAQLTFQDFAFCTRFSNERPVEKIDDYLREDGRLPVVIMPYENWVPWFQSKYIAFAEKSLTAGVFIRDCLEWKESGYPIWGSNRKFGMTFHYENDTLSARFPLQNGQRRTAIAVYPGNDVQKIAEFWKWYAFLDLDKVRHWKLSWEEPQNQYPKFFNKAMGNPWKGNYGVFADGETVTPAKMDEIIDRRSESANHIERMSPVGNREFAEWAVCFDLTAADMTKEQFDRSKAFFCFMAYAAKDENYMPTQNLLAGHPNFLGDTLCVSGFVAALFPHHPEHGQFLNYFNEVGARNLEYHIRPDVKAYHSLGGRETENLGAYSLAMLRPYLHASCLLHRCGYPTPLEGPKAAKWLNWMVNTLSAPIDGRRMLPQQGAHCRKSEIPYSIYEFAQLLEPHYPEIAQNAYAACKNAPLGSFEVARCPEDDPYYHLFRRGGDGELTLQSEKFTGYGCIFREAVGTPDEISLHVQQLDRGPNYRWGEFENTGNGGVFYYAAGKRYSFVAPEDSGDRNLGAEEATCGFAVLKGHTYHNIGFQDLTEPMYVFPILKQIKLLPGDSIAAYYKYRRVALVGKDYAVFYDALTHMRAHGQFIWTVNQLEEFPQIWQLVPGVPARVPMESAAAFVTGNGDAVHYPEGFRSKTVSYEGNGNFLTIVSHRKDMNVKRTEFGGLVELPERTDYVFEDQARIDYESETVCFHGYSGIASFGRDGSVSGAMTQGRQISVTGLEIQIEGKAGVFFCNKDGGWSGQISTDNGCTVTLNGGTVNLEEGSYAWKLEIEFCVTKLPDRDYDPVGKFVRDTRRHEFGFVGYDFDDEGEILTYPQ